MHQQSQENRKFIKVYRLYTYIFILFHIFIVFIAFYNMKLKVYGIFINLTVIQCRNRYYLAISRHVIFGVMTSLVGSPIILFYKFEAYFTTFSFSPAMSHH